MAESVREPNLMSKLKDMVDGSDGRKHQRFKMQNTEHQVGVLHNNYTMSTTTTGTLELDVCPVWASKIGEGFRLATSWPTGL